MTNEMISIFPLSTSHMHVHVAICHYQMHMAYRSLNWFDMKLPALHTISFFSPGRLLKDMLTLQGFLQSRWMPTFRKFYDRYTMIIKITNFHWAICCPAPDPTFAFVEGPCCPTLDFVIAFWLRLRFTHC
jgi:hypothetical protein